MMTDDPRDILTAAGVECAEVAAFYAAYDCADHRALEVAYLKMKADQAIRALALLLADDEAVN